MRSCVVELDAPGVARHEPDDHVERGGLAGAVGPEQPDHFAVGDLHGKIAHHLALLVALRQAGRLERAHCGGFAAGFGSLPGRRPWRRPACSLPGVLCAAMVMWMRSSVPGWTVVALLPMACTRCARML